VSSVSDSTVGFLAGRLSRDRIRFWGVQSGVSFLDQGLTSGTSFVLNLFLARWLTPEGYGAFALAFATLLFVSGFHNVLLLEPMSVFGPAGYALNTVPYFKAQLKVHFVLTAGLSAFLLLITVALSILGIRRELVLATAASTLAFPLVLLLWSVRRMCYVVHRPGIAAWASAGYFIALVVGLFWVRWTDIVSPPGAMLLMALASLAAVLVPLRMLGMFSLKSETHFSWRKVLRENWAYGRWLVASTTLFSVASQIQTYSAAALLGVGAAGVLRAMQMPSLIMTQVVSAMGLLLLPVMAREYGLGHIDRLRKKAVVSSVLIGAMAVAYAGTLGIFAKPIENLMYAGKFSSSAWLIPVFGLVPVCTGFANGFSMALRASQKPHFDLLANGISAPVGLVTAVLFIKLWGLQGAAISMVAGFAVYGAVFVSSFKGRFAVNDPNPGDCEQLRLLSRAQSATSKYFHIRHGSK
jgi:O-antigen/teichoic acid export membrane protein